MTSSEIEDAETLCGIQFHEHANIFPLLKGRALDELVSDIAEHGLREPIMIFGGKVLDGRNRMLAMLRLDPNFSPKSAPKMFATFDGDDTLEWVISKNLHRRHLNESQRAIVAAKASLASPGKNRWHRGLSSPRAAKMLNVSHGLVNEAKRFIRARPKDVAAVEAGERRIGRHRFDGMISAAVGAEMRDQFTALCERLGRSKYDVVKELVSRSISGEIHLRGARQERRCGRHSNQTHLAAR